MNVELFLFIIVFLISAQSIFTEKQYQNVFKVSFTFHHLILVHKVNNFDREKKTNCFPWLFIVPFVVHCSLFVP